MKLSDLAIGIGAKIVAPPRDAASEIEAVYAGDCMSDLLNHAGGGTLLVSNLAAAHLTRMAGLLDVPGICLLNDIIPDGELVRAAIEHGACLMVSPWGMFETCGRLYQLLGKTAQR